MTVPVTTAGVPGAGRGQARASSWLQSDSERIFSIKSHVMVRLRLAGGPPSPSLRLTVINLGTPFLLRNNIFNDVQMAVARAIVVSAREVQLHAAAPRPGPPRYPGMCALCVWSEQLGRELLSKIAAPPGNFGDSAKSPPTRKKSFPAPQGRAVQM